MHKIISMNTWIQPAVQAGGGVTSHTSQKSQTGFMNMRTSVAFGMQSNISINSNIYNIWWRPQDCFTKYNSRHKKTCPVDKIVLQ